MNDISSIENFSPTRNISSIEDNIDDVNKDTVTGYNIDDPDDIDIYPFKNDICRLIVLKNKHLLATKINCLSAVFFKSKNYSKNFNIYVNGLRKLIKLVNKSRTNYKLILFIDMNVKNDPDIMKIINNSDKVIPILFSCFDYMNSNYHIELFATLIRFFPYFDYPNNFTKNVISVDIDLKYDDRNKLQSLMKLDLDTFTGNAMVKDLIYSNEKGYIFASNALIPKRKLDHKQMSDFIRNAHMNKSLGKYEKRFSPFGFGTDEIFLNDYILPNFETYNIMLDYQISYFMFHSRDFLLNSRNYENSKKLLSIMMDKLQRLNINEKYFMNTKDNYLKFQDMITSTNNNQRIYPSSDMTLENMLDFIDQNTYGIRKRTEINDIISISFSEIIRTSLDKNKKFIEKNVMDFISTYLLNLISAKILITVEYKTNRIIGVKKYETVYDSTI
jgi:hypothetical protein